MAHSKVTVDAEPAELELAELEPALDPAELEPLAALDEAALLAGLVEELAVLSSEPQAARNNAAAAKMPAVFTTDSLRVIFTQILHVFSCH